MRTRTTITLEPVVAQQLKHQANISKYINELIIADLYNKSKDTLVDRTVQAVLKDTRVEDYIDTRISRALAELRQY